MNHQNLVYQYEMQIDILLFWLENHPKDHPKWWLYNQMRIHFVHKLLKLTEHDYS